MRSCQLGRLVESELRILPSGERSSVLTPRQGTWKERLHSFVYLGVGELLLDILACLYLEAPA